MTTKINLEYCGMPGTGRTVTEAKQDAARKIERALGGDYHPIAISFSGRTAILYRTPSDGWRYALVHPADEKDYLYGGLCGYHADPDDVEQDARRHLVDLADWKTDEAIARNLAFLRRDLDGQREYLRRIRFSWCYLAWTETGLTDSQAHMKACDDTWPDGVQPWAYQEPAA